MGENKGHGNKAPDYPELDDMGSAASRAGQSAVNQQSAGGQLDISGQQLDSLQSGNLQSGNRQSGQDIGNLQGQQQGKQQGKQLSKQKGGQHASGGTPALDDLDAQQGSRQSGSQGNASQADWEQLQDKKQDR